MSAHVNSGGAVKNIGAIYLNNTSSAGTGKKVLFVYGNESGSTKPVLLWKPKPKTPYVLDAKLSSSSSKSSLAAAADGNGSVYFAGGNSSAAVDRLSTAETVSAVAAMSHPRYSHAGAACGSYAMFAGGYGRYTSGGVTHNGAELYVEKYSTSGAKTSAADLSQARSSLCGVSCPDGKAVFAGGTYTSNGVQRYASNVDVYSSNGSSHTTWTSLSAGRMSIGGASAADSAVYLGGGAAGSASNRLDIYTASGARTYRSLSKLSGAAFAGYAGDGNIAFVNATTSLNALLEIYSPVQQASTTQYVTGSKQGGAVCADGDGNVLCSGGSNNKTNVWAYTKTGAVAALTEHQVSRTLYCGVKGGNGSVYFAGGSPNGDKIECYPASCQ